MNANYPTRIFIQGWGFYPKQAARLAEAYKEKFQNMVNFIFVNWERGAHVETEFDAAANVYNVGKQVALLLEFLIETFTTPRFRELLALVGHSVGVHAAGAGEHNIYSVHN